MDFSFLATFTSAGFVIELGVSGISNKKTAIFAPLLCIDSPTSPALQVPPIRGCIEWLSRPLTLRQRTSLNLNTGCSNSDALACLRSSIYSSDVYHKHVCLLKDLLFKDDIK